MNTIFSWRQLRLAFAVVIAAVLALAGLAMPSQAETSQATIGNINPEADTSLTIHKFEQPVPAWNLDNDGTEITVPGDANALEGVVFSVRQLTDIDLTTVAGWTAARNMDVATALTSTLGSDLGDATNASGELVINDLPVGLYLVQETNPGDNNIVSPAAPFLVAIPQPSGEGDWNYNVHVYPKNSLFDAPVKEVDDREAFKLGDIVNWTITASVPVMSEGNQYNSYIITDQLDSRLGFAGATVSLNGTQLDAADYTITPDVTDPTTAGVLVTITLTESGLDKLNALDTAGAVTVDLETEVLSIGSGFIPNEAIVFINDPNQESDGTPTNEPETKWGALKITKHAEDNEDALLQDAVFNLYVNDGDTDNPVAGDLILKDLTTDASGQILVEGLKEGEYVLVETAAPAGYLLDETPRAITIVAGSVAEPNLYSVPNEQEPPFNLPLTGGTGTMLFTIAGLVLLFGAGAGYTILRKRRES